MKRIEVASLDERALVVKEYEIARELAGTRFRHALGQVEKNSDLRALRKARARLKTEIRRREIESGLPQDELYRRNAAALRAVETDSSAETEQSSKSSGGLFANLRRRLIGDSDGE